MNQAKWLPSLIIILGLTCSSRLIGALIKIQHWLLVDDFLFGNTILLAIALVLIIVLAPKSKAAPIIRRPYAFMPLMLKRLLRISIAIVFVGALFKIQHWKGADIMLIVSLSACAMLLLAWSAAIAKMVWKADNGIRP